MNAVSRAIIPFYFDTVNRLPRVLIVLGMAISVIVVIEILAYCHANWHWRPVTFLDLSFCLLAVECGLLWLMASCLIRMGGVRGVISLEKITIHSRVLPNLRFSTINYKYEAFEKLRLEIFPQQPGREGHALLFLKGKSGVADLCIFRGDIEAAQTIADHLGSALALQNYTIIV